MSISEIAYRFDVKPLCLCMFLYAWRRVSDSSNLTKSGFRMFLFTRFYHDLKLFFFSFWFTMILWFCIGDTVAPLVSFLCLSSRNDHDIQGNASVVLELPNFRLKLLCWCSMFLVRTFLKFYYSIVTRVV